MKYNLSELRKCAEEARQTRKFYWVVDGFRFLNSIEMLDNETYPLFFNFAKECIKQKKCVHFNATALRFNSVIQRERLVPKNLVKRYFKELCKKSLTKSDFFVYGRGHFFSRFERLLCGYFSLLSAYIGAVFDIDYARNIVSGSESGRSVQEKFMVLGVNEFKAEFPLEYKKNIRLKYLKKILEVLKPLAELAIEKNKENEFCLFAKSAADFLFKLDEFLKTNLKILPDFNYLFRVDNLKYYSEALKVLADWAIEAFKNNKEQELIDLLKFHPEEGISKLPPDLIRGLENNLRKLAGK